MPGGFLGVEVFFVVSGYLITSLLLAERRDTGSVSFRTSGPGAPAGSSPRSGCCSRSSSRTRSLFLPDAIDMLKGDVIAALFYVSNWWQIIAHRSYFATAGRPELLKHLWSLAIEEQYYLFWPLMLVLGLRKLGRQRMVVTMFVAASCRRCCSAISRA